MMVLVLEVEEMSMKGTDEVRSETGQRETDQPSLASAGIERRT